ncbi:unnamed protein product [Kuraishia capsulata CBS 1993]|uniref:Uncharacterized protein n=1 Tax=Kuraishia capsulata CBS 1993 TaxID=1382522 RepID=W6MIX1_9ASCO|nr:uncharacterized protein KUCA_T00000303001 [Kuraishia capsulata CBS 1993]CDK24342.1 unnamed protein product [Kuraishia capsulata CBS 1993]
MVGPEVPDDIKQIRRVRRETSAPSNVDKISLVEQHQRDNQSNKKDILYNSQHGLNSEIRQEMMKRLSKLDSKFEQ